MEHQKDSGDGEDDEKEAGDASETKGISELKTVAFDLCRKDMEEEVMIDEHGAFQVGIGDSGSENRTPHCRFKNAL